MSDGTFNFPERITHPDTPAAGRVKLYMFDSGSGVEPYYKLDDASENTLKGDQGDTGPQGPQGIQGIQGIQGPAGPMNVEGLVLEAGTVTLPNSTTPSIVYTDSITLSTTGDHFLIVFLAVRPHSTGNDMEFFVEFDGNPVGPDYIEEHKDSSADQSMWRTAFIPLGNQVAGTYDLDLLFSKESTGGTAQLKYYASAVVRYS